MVARAVVGLSAVLATAALALAPGPSAPTTHVLAGDPAAADGTGPDSARRVVQGEVLAVLDGGRQLEASITLQWAPEVAAVDERARFATDGRTRLVPSDGGVASLRPGDPVQIVAVPRDGPGWQAVEVTKLDLD